MRVIQLPDILYEYLVHVIEKHASSGIHPEEGLAVSKLWDAVTKKVTHIDDAQIAKMAAAATPAQGVLHDAGHDAGHEIYDGSTPATNPLTDENPNKGEATDVW